MHRVSEESPTGEEEQKSVMGPKTWYWGDRDPNLLVLARSLPKYSDAEEVNYLFMLTFTFKQWCFHWLI